MFSVRPFLDIQEEILDIAEFSLAAMSSTLVPVVKIVVSSANSAEATGAIDCGRSLMNMENNVGPSTEPCGTPAVIGQVGDNTPANLTACSRFCR